MFARLAQQEPVIIGPESSDPSWWTIGLALLVAFAAFSSVKRWLGGAYGFARKARLANIARLEAKNAAKAQAAGGAAGARAGVDVGGIHVNLGHGAGARNGERAGVHDDHRGAYDDGGPWSDDDLEYLGAGGHDELDAGDYDDHLDAHDHHYRAGRAHAGGPRSTAPRVVARATSARGPGGGARRAEVVAVGPVRELEACDGCGSERTYRGRCDLCGVVLCRSCVVDDDAHGPACRVGAA